MASLTRKQVLGHRLQVNNLLGSRLPHGSLTDVARSGLQDGSPRSALLSLAARIDGVEPEDWRAKGLAQVFGPRGAIYVVPETDVEVFTRGLLPRDPERVEALQTTESRVHQVLDGKPMRQADVVAALPDIGGTRGLRWAATLGTLVPTWDTVDTIVHPVGPPTMDAETARLELARRFFQYLGPATTSDLRWWLDGLTTDAKTTVAALGDELCIVESDGQRLHALAGTPLHDSVEPDPESVHLLPPDDSYINRLHRHVLVPSDDRRRLLWPKAPPPGALIIGGEAAGTWRRRGGSVEVSQWDEVPQTIRDHAEAIAAAWPIPMEPNGVRVRWVQPS